MNREELAKAIFASSHITGHFVLRSGAVSHEYFDKYQFESNPFLLGQIAEHLLELLPLEYDYLAGLEIGGIPIAVALSLKTGKPVTLVRKKAKDYGTCKLAEGPDIAGKKVVVVEDVVTSGGQVAISSKDLKAIGAEVVGAICVIDREAGGIEALAEAGVQLRALFNMTELKAYSE